MLASSLFSSIFVSAIAAAASSSASSTSVSLQSIFENSVNELHLATCDQGALGMLYDQWKTLSPTQADLQWAQKVGTNHLEGILAAIKTRPSLVGLGMALLPLDLIFPLNLPKPPFASIYVNHLGAFMAMEVGARHPNSAVLQSGRLTEFMTNYLNNHPLPFPVTSEIAEGFFDAFLPII